MKNLVLWFEIMTVIGIVWLASILCGFLSGLTLGRAANRLWPETAVAKPPMKLYRYAAPGVEATELHADSIRLVDGCVEFIRDGEIDTIICDGLTRFSVTNRDSGR